MPTQPTTPPETTGSVDPDTNHTQAQNAAATGVNHQLATRVLRIIKQRTNLLATDEVLGGTDRLEARAPLHKVTLNVPGIVIYLSGYSIEKISGKEPGDEPAYEATKGDESGSAWNVADRLLGLTPTDTNHLFSHPTKRTVIAAFEQLAAGADQIDWTTIRR
ncbi:hypothetical protein [Streptomyces lydicus]|uniref:hypothetical protein n=1 Tax=Streptomyces lydicus TaxID=47763 RepID=UPI001012B7FD|nr:hypothetical protein [Streptomyces lydicus]MCZ1012311.1 hypothetical protein [Streptomyces lydicus]